MSLNSLNGYIILTLNLPKDSNLIEYLRCRNGLNVQDERVNLAIIAANNHYAGFGPGTANIFRNMIGLPDAKWQANDEDVQEQRDQHHEQDHDMKQSTLSDFL